MYDCFAIERSLAELGNCYEGNPWEPDNKKTRLYRRVFLFTAPYWLSGNA